MVAHSLDRSVWSECDQAQVNKSSTNETNQLIDPFLKCLIIFSSANNRISRFDIRVAWIWSRVRPYWSILYRTVRPIEKLTRKIVWLSSNEYSVCHVRIHTKNQTQCRKKKKSGKNIGQFFNYWICREHVQSMNSTTWMCAESRLALGNWHFLSWHALLWKY